MGGKYIITSYSNLRNIPDRQPLSSCNDRRETTVEQTCHILIPCLRFPPAIFSESYLWPVCAYKDHYYWEEKLQLNILHLWVATGGKWGLLNVISNWHIYSSNLHFKERVSLTLASATDWEYSDRHLTLAPFWSLVISKDRALPSFLLQSKVSGGLAQTLHMWSGNYSRSCQ